MRIKQLFFISTVITLFSCGNSNDNLPQIELIPYSTGSEYGYIDWEGKIVVNPQFSEAGLFYDGIALVKTTGDERRFGYIDEKGKYVIKPEFISATNFSDGIALTVKPDEAPKGIDKKGKVLFELKEAKNVREFREGLAAFSVENEEGKIRWGFINKKGETVIKPQFIDVSFFSEDKCGIENESEKWGYIDTEGKIIINPQFSSTQPFENNKAVVWNDGRAGVIDDKGTYLINPQFRSIVADGDLYLIKSASGYYGWADKKGTIVINPQFDQAGLFGENKIAPIEAGRQWGYIDKEGKYIIDPQFDEAFPFFRGKAIVDMGDYGIINEKGKFLVNPQFDDLGNGYVRAVSKNRELTSVETDYFDMEPIFNELKKEITATTISGFNFSTPVSEIMTKHNIDQSRYYYSDINPFQNKKISKETSLSLNVKGEFIQRQGWNYSLNPNATASEFIYTLHLNGKAYNKDEDILRQLDTIFKGFEKILSPSEGKAQYKNDKFLITCDSDDYHVNIKIMPAGKITDQSMTSNNAKPVIDTKWITLPTDKEFRWMKWEEAPEAIKEATKYAIQHFSAKDVLYDDIQTYLKENCEVEIAVTDLNENGIYGFALSCSGIYCCGAGAHGCSVQFIEDGGVLYSELGQDHAFAITPDRNAVVSSVNKKFPFIQNNKISSQKQYQLKEYFRYK